MNTASARILIVEDDPGLALLFGEKLRRVGCNCETVDSACKCLAFLERQAPDLMVLDYSLPDLLAPALVEELRSHGRLPAFIVVTGHGDERVAVELMKLGARDYLVKDHLVFDRLPAVVLRALQEVENERRLAAAEEALLQSEERLRVTLAITQIGAWDWDLEHDQWFGSPTYFTMLGYESEAGPADRGVWLERLHPEDCAEVAAKIAAVLAGGAASYEYEGRIRHADGFYRWHRVSGHVVKRNDAGRALRMLGIRMDITEQRRAEGALRESLHEKEALIKEVHHRVKNNLQVVTSLLRLQVGQSDNPGTREVLRDMQHRIRSMALLHETLYRSGDLSRVDLADYLQNVCTQLLRAAANHAPGTIRLQFDLAAVSVAATQAVPCGLLVNELVSNCLKHAFPGGRAGEVRVSLQPVDGGPALRLQVADDGVGLPADFALPNLTSLGLHLVSDLGEQLEGVVEIGPGPGALFSVTFTPQLSITRERA